MSITVYNGIYLERLTPVDKLKEKLTELENSKDTQQMDVDAKHYWLPSVVIEFVHEGAGMSTNLNVLISNRYLRITKAMIERIQVQAQVQLAKSLGEKMPEVQHVYIQSIGYLGHMTEEEFLGTQEPVPAVE